MYTGTLADQNISNITATGADPVYPTASCTDTYGTSGKMTNGVLWNQTWDQQSIAPVTYVTGTYSFPQTAIQAWLWPPQI
jgi:hypothetical protein